MKFGKLFKFAKKGAKAASSKKGAAPDKSWPSGTKIGIFGHENSGKTVYFTVLNEESKIAKDIQMSITDNFTAGKMLANYRSIWGLSTSQHSGTVVDQRGEKKFPDPTINNHLMQFTAILDRSKKVPVVSLDYPGKSVSISDRTDKSEQVYKFMDACDGLLFFFDPKILGAELEIQARAAAYVNMLERIVPLKSRIPIPIGLVISKADTLPGFKGEGQTVLVNPEDEHMIAEDYELFLEKVLNSNKIVADTTWAASVRSVLVKLREFIRVVVGRTLNFQIFFVSNTGNEPVKIGADIGRSVYAPPDKINPSGVKEPMYWILNSIIRNKRLNVLRKIVKLVTILSLIWIIACSVPFLYHFNILFSKPVETEKTILRSVENHHLSTSDNQRSEIMRAYNRYKNNWMVRQFFPGYQLAATHMSEIYKDFNIGKAITKLDNLITEFSRIVADQNSWPKYNPSKDSLVLTDKHNKLLEGISAMHIGDEDSPLYLRSDRALIYWEMFTQFIKNREDMAQAEKINEQVGFDKSNAPHFSPAEEKLGQSLLSFAKIKEKVVAKKVESEEGLTEYKSLKKKINRSKDAAYVLGQAVSDLTSIKKSLNSESHSAEISAINKFIKDVDKWKKSRQYTYKLEAVPDFGHLHIAITPDGGDPSWSDSEGQLLEGTEGTFSWKIGDDIHIAFDELKHTCQWGIQPSDKIVLKDKYDLFKMEGSLTFPNIGKTITISFKDGLKDRLPKLK